MNAQEMNKLATANANKIIDTFYLDCKASIRQAALEGRNECDFSNEGLKKEFVLDIFKQRLGQEGFKFDYSSSVSGRITIKW